MSLYKPFRLPENLGLGCSTAATQIEGGDTNNSWYVWAKQPGKIKGGTSPIRANDHWERMEADVSLMASLGIRYYRLGIEWSRIEPSRGHFDEAAMAHYRKEIELLLANNIRPLVTLHHFTNPLWFEEMGAFEIKACVPIFINFVTYAVTRLQDLCSEYVTINEPNVYATLGYVYGTWPPGQKSVWKALKVMRHMTLCHLQAYRTIHQIYGDRPVVVGFANYLRVFTPASEKLRDRFGASVLRLMFQDDLTRSFMTGRLTLPLGLGAPLGRGPFYDFIGINYYSRVAVHGFQMSTMPDAPTNDLGWEIYPEGLAALCQEQYKRYQAPIWITENGTCVFDDWRRISYIYEHLKQLADSGLPVDRYYYWTLMDNFEWAEGESAPFGLVACDFETQIRTVRPSGRFYADLIRNGQVSQEMIDQYLPEQPRQA